MGLQHPAQLCSGEMVEDPLEIALRVAEHRTSVVLHEIGGVPEPLGPEAQDLDHGCIPRACIPPVMFAASSKPDMVRKAAAWRLRPPERQTTRVGRLGSRESREDGRSA